MKRAVSISLGSSTRDHKVILELLGEPISVERIGTDGDLARAMALYADLDGAVDAFGVGGTDLGLQVEERYYPLRAAHKMVSPVRQTPVVDGGGVRSVLERHIMQRVEAEIGDQIAPKQAMITVAVDRYDMALSFHHAGYQTVYCDLMFGLGVPIAVRGLTNLQRLARFLMPVVGRLPMSVLYPTGEKQHQIVPRYEKWYRWASVIAGDFNYIRRHLPPRLDGKVVVTNTTTAADVELLKGRGVRYLATTTPRFEGRSFGTNVIEAALTAVAGKGRTLTGDEIQGLLDRLGFRPTITRLD
ncbi:MAG: quinate 5-dehydrogenase [Chloroflexota bacterium]